MQSLHYQKNKEMMLQNIKTNAIMQDGLKSLWNNVFIPYQIKYIKISAALTITNKLWDLINYFLETLCCFSLTCLICTSALCSLSVRLCKWDIHTVYLCSCLCCRHSVEEFNLAAVCVGDFWHAGDGLKTEVGLNEVWLIFRLFFYSITVIQIYHKNWKDFHFLMQNCLYILKYIYRPCNIITVSVRPAANLVCF